MWKFGAQDLSALRQFVIHLQNSATIELLRPDRSVVVRCCEPDSGLTRPQPLTVGNTNQCRYEHTHTIVMYMYTHTYTHALQNIHTYRRTHTNTQTYMHACIAKHNMVGNPCGRFTVQKKRLCADCCPTGRNLAVFSSSSCFTCMETCTGVRETLVEFMAAMKYMSRLPFKLRGLHRGWRTQTPRSGPKNSCRRLRTRAVPEPAW